VNPLQFEKTPAKIFKKSRDGYLYAAAEAAAIIRKKQSVTESCKVAFGTGPSFYSFYDEILRLHREEGLSFGNVELYLLAEYYPISPKSLQSSVRFLRDFLINHIDIPESGVHLFDSSINENKLEFFCREYEESIIEGGGLDFVLSGIGNRGHVGFNAPGSSADSLTRIVTLDQSTITSAAGDFFGESYVPAKGFTLGLGTVMNAGKLFFAAWGESSAGIIRKIVEEPISDQVPASLFQRHPDARFLLDESSASELTRLRTPWFVDTPEWDNPMIRKAVVWLCRKVNKPILKLTDRDYNDYHMNSLLTVLGSAYEVNIKVFNELQHTITGWPGGKPDADDTNRPERAEPARKRVVIFSPHPDDDVISMGGTFIRLVDQGHEVHIAYQTSGSIAVFDEDVLQYIDFFQELHKGLGLDKSETMKLFDRARDTILKKKSGVVDSHDLSSVKTYIRKSEARASCRFIGIPEERIHFLDMPFYDTGLVSKSPLEPADIKLVSSLLDTVKPHQIYAAGDLNDPHGTHRTCLNAVFTSIAQLQNAAWMNNCRIWLYRGAWQEWPVNEIDMVVPMSPDELIRKRKAIFKHQSQKDSALFPGSDSREFWQRSEARNRELAALYNQLGLAEYEAMEGFKRILLSEVKNY